MGVVKMKYKKHIGLFLLILLIFVLVIFAIEGYSNYIYYERILF